MSFRKIHWCLGAALLVAPLSAQTLPECAGDAGAELNQGVSAFKQGQYSMAAAHFQGALELDAHCLAARLYLGTAYMQMYIPGAENPENVQFADNAREEFQKVLDEQADNEVALASMASLYLNQKKLDEAKTWYEKLAAMNPQNKEAFYTLGVIAWTRAFKPRVDARAKLGMKADEPGPLKDAEVRQALRAKSLPIVQEGIDDLNKALEIDPEYDDAMAYMNLLYREKADLENSSEDYKADIVKADDWMLKVVEARKSKASRQP
jgi:tetratricopeptide (TPR) repeat protein